MVMRKISVVILFIVNESLCVEWPSYIKRCTTNEHNLDSCLLAAAKDAIPKIANGSSELGLIPLDPLRFTNMSTTSNRRGVKLDFDITQGAIEGMTKMDIKKIRYDKEKHTLTIDAAFKKIKMTGNYKVRGRLFFLTLRSKGYFEMITNNLDAHHKVKLIPSRKKGFYDMDLDYKIKKLGGMSMVLQDSILPPIAEETFNDVVNDNWESISDSFIPTMERAINQIFKQVMAPMFHKFPLTTIFPDQD